MLCVPERKRRSLRKSAFFPFLDVLHSTIPLFLYYIHTYISFCFFHHFSQYYNISRAFHLFYFLIIFSNSLTFLSLIHTFSFYSILLFLIIFLSLQLLLVFPIMPRRPLCLGSSVGLSPLMYHSLLPLHVNSNASISSRD